MGPSLVDQLAHRDIHEAARADMETGTQLLYTSLSGEDAATALRIARELARGWRQRVLAHADAEEQDVFPEVLARLPQYETTVAALIRDHALMRLLVDEIEQELEREGPITPDVLGRFTTLLHVQRLHSAFEEESFLPEISGALKSAAKPLGEARTAWPNA